MVKSDPYRTLGLKKELLSTIEDFDWLVKTVALGEHIGKKSSRRLGVGLEFSQYRPYSQGDDLRQLDWKIYARTDKFYIKQSEIDTNISVTFIPDQSASMKYVENGWSKQAHAKLLMAVLAYLSSENGDKYGISGVHESDLGVVPHIGKKHWQRFLNHLIHLEDSKIFSKPMIPKVQEKELFVVFSDLYEKDEEWLDFIRNLKTRRNEVIVFHIMGEDELNFNFNKTTLFKDLEDGSELKIDPKALKENYQIRLNQWIKELRENFRNEGVDYALINMKEPVDEVITKFMWHRKKLG
ncbi:MAG: DUF58 domain-containing protein [Flammeovirgaceae bacterium]|nr:DUF58 domain-containing protein [Flammeovirgaceae bacterium]MBE61184.1 DUF58 domain-containing protein [Flammeovirgaceae bacterium]HCX22230.1 DUF58 domain-containing protein [Cytophagales bacterium]